MTLEKEVNQKTTSFASDLDLRIEGVFCSSEWLDSKIVHEIQYELRQDE